MNMFKTLFIFVWIVFPFGQLARLQLTSDVAFNVLDGVLTLLVLVWVLKGKYKSQHFVFLKSKSIFIVLCLVSLFLNSFNLSSNQFLVAFLYLLRFVIYSSIYLIVASFEKKEKNKVSFWMLLSGLFFVVLGYVQYFYYPDLRNLYYLGWDEHMYRMFSTFLDPNFAGIFFVLYFMFVGNHILKNKKGNVFWIGVLILTLGAVYLSFSRTALLMLFMSVITYLVLVKKARLILLLLGISAGVILISSQFFYIENLNLLRTTSSFARLESMKDAFMIIQKNPIVGVGFNTYRYAQIRYGLENDKTQYVSHSQAGTDNSYLFVWATTGIIGLISFLYIWYRVIRVCLHKKILNHELVLSSVIGFLFSGLFINSLFYPLLIVWIWSVIGITENT